jgi:dihydroorotase
MYKVNPPLRRLEDVTALRQAVADGTVDIIATDHAPHPHEDKDCEWAAAAMGMLGLETAFSIALLTLVEPGLLTWRQLADRMSIAPAKIGRVSDQGRDLAVGEPANITVVDPRARTVVDPTRMASKSRNTPYAGMELPGQVMHVFYSGRCTVRDGELA